MMNDNASQLSNESTISTEELTQTTKEVTHETE